MTPLEKPWPIIDEKCGPIDAGWHKDEPTREPWAVSLILPSVCPLRVGPNLPARSTDKLHMNVTFTVEDLAAAVDAAVSYVMDGDTRLHAKHADPRDGRLLASTPQSRASRTGFALASLRDNGY
jgi:hypothetical protein